MSDPEQAPKKPTEFIYAYGMRRLVPVLSAQDALGRELLGDQATIIEDDVRHGDAELELQYWDDMHAFFGISDKDADDMPLEELAETYQFTGQNYEHAKSLGSLTLNWMRESAGLSASMDTEYYRTRLENDVKTLRNDLALMFTDPTTRLHLDWYLDKPKTGLPTFFKDMKMKADGAPMQWSEWLAKGATTEQFMNFLQWHNRHMHDVNEDPKTAEAINKQKQEYTEMLQKFADEGFFNAGHVRSKLEYPGLHSVHVYIGDVFATTARDMDGYFLHRPNYNWQYVIVGEGSIETATKHELNHAFLGQFSDRWLNEATTEHIAVAMRKGEMGPVNELTDEGVYTDERGLLHEVMSGGSEAIPLQTLFQGYTETKYNWSKNEFEKAVDKSWGEGALRKIGDAVKEVEEGLIADGKPVFRARALAAEYVGAYLATQPSIVFGENYKKPQHAST